jgi:hypothetical protein
MQVKYQVVGEGSADLMSADEFQARFGDRFVQPDIIFDGLREVLKSQPQIRNLCGPMYNGEQDGFQIVRYESWAVYEALSN